MAPSRRVRAVLDGVTLAESDETIVVVGESRTAGEAVGGYTISAALSAAGGPGVLTNYAITSNTATFTISQAGQSITFAAPASPAVYGSSFAAAPTATSGLAVTVTPSGGCSIAAGTVTMTSGTVDCVLTASQAGDASYTAAADVVHTVVAQTRAASVTPDALGKTFGAADPLLTGTLTGFLAADNVTASYSRVAGEAVGSYTISAALSAADGTRFRFNVFRRQGTLGHRVRAKHHRHHRAL